MGKEKTAGKRDAPAPQGWSSVFAHADAVDVALMVLGLLGAVGDGMSTPLRLFISSRIANDFGSDRQQIGSRINENVRNILWLALASWFTAFLGRGDFDLKSGALSDVITSVSNDSLVVQDALSEKVPNFLVNVSLFFSCYAVGFALMWQLTLVALPSVLLLVVPGFMYARVLVGLARRVRDQYARPGALAAQAVSSARTVYSFVAETRIMAQFSSALEESARLGVKQGLAKGLALGSNGISYLISAFNFWYSSRLVMYHGYPAGAPFAVCGCLIIGGMHQPTNLMCRSLGTALSNVKYFSDAVTAAERVLEMIGRVPKIDTGSDAGEVLDNVAGEVEFKNVEFSYPSRPESPIFVSFSLRVPAGRTVALVGSSGSGKSTAIALLQRFYDPSAGEVALDGVDIRRLRLKWLRSQMGLVSQEPALFATSVRENILFGKEDATEEEIVAAAKAANAHSFISQLPQGYDTQKQRIAIARAIVKSPKILLLDEATSALDTKSERVVQEALELASMGRTTIVIAHRLSTIRNADMIAVIQSGELKELASHGELIADDNSIYSSLVHLQQTSEAMVIGEAGSNASADVAQSSNHSISKKFSSVGESLSARSMADTRDDDNATDTKPKLPVPSFKRLLMLNAPEWKYALTGSLSAALFGGISPLFAYGMGSIGLILAQCGQHYNFGAMGEYLTKRVREQMLTKILTFEIGWFDRVDNSSGAICSQLANDANVVRSLVGDRMALVIQTISAVLISGTLGVVIAWRLALVMIAVQPLVIIGFYTRRVLLKSMSKKSTLAQSESSKLAAEAVSNFRTISSFSSQDRILRLFGQAQDGPRKEGIRQSWYAGLILGTTTCLMACTWALDFWYGGKLMSEGRISKKALFQTFMILVSTGRVIAEAGSMTTDLAKGGDAVASVFAVLDRETEIDPDSPDGYKPKKLSGDIEIRGVDFVYPSRPDVLIFKSFSLSIQPGKSMAIVGQSGSGKSTIIGLIERFYDPLRGVVKIDGRNIKTYNLRALRQHIGLVSQEPTLFSGTIRENIMYGTETATEAEMENAARSANAHDFISGLKDGYDTWCGEQGAQLSGGQKQRVAIARAILKNPSILLLDEATSALDIQSERAVQEALDRLMVGRTSVVVAHRLSTVQTCDLIAVLDKGVVVEEGTHTSLMAKGSSGTYFGLVSLQNGGNGH
ncbi:hypothetical protein PR202_gb08754 [Eleusine coracana subsp. coracana]|uniref:Uncharacterized protein n=1 Tax=Eleusine coracana subsp. coracana TaxID=191504 RepID=A0AAV5EFF8_ELECO|nr:hypothetical protein PR202_gb08754 [Eleusine coracana subsp. coracana]